MSSATARDNRLPCCFHSASLRCFDRFDGQFVAAVAAAAAAAAAVAIAAVAVAIAAAAARCLWQKIWSTKEGELGSIRMKSGMKTLTC